MVHDITMDVAIKRAVIIFELACFLFTRRCVYLLKRGRMSLVKEVEKSSMKIVMG
jgi:hypothetical protein